MSREGQALTFKYDHNGMRVQKVLEHSWYPETTHYTLHGKLITHMTVDYTDWDEIAQQDKLHFFYDAQSRPAFVEYNGTKYAYVLNLQGDIVALLDSNGAVMVEYNYDAWGRQISTTGTLAETLGKRNPFRYRGYVYDEETELYYLRNRYYSVAQVRFITPDRSLRSMGNVSSLNLFAYCRNIPVHTYDSDGKDLIVITASTGAMNFGHTSLLVQDENGAWYYYYYGPIDPDAKEVINLENVDAKVIYQAIKLTNIDTATEGFFTSLNRLVKEFHDQREGEHVTYDQAFYVYGNFEPTHQKALAQASAGKNIYNLLANNCVTNSVDMIMHSVDKVSQVGKALVHVIESRKGSNIFNIIGLAIPNIVHKVLNDIFAAFNFKI